MLVHYSRLTVCQSEDTSPAPLLPGVGLHGDTTAEDHWPLHRRHQSCNKQTWPLATETRPEFKPSPRTQQDNCKLNQYNLTILQNLNSTLVLFLHWHFLPKPEQTYFAFIHLISKYKTQSFCKLMERQVAENFGKVADMNERCPIALTYYQKLKVCPYSNISTFCRGRSCLLNSLQAFILMFLDAKHLYW